MNKATIMLSIKLAVLAFFSTAVQAQPARDCRVPAPTPRHPVQWNAYLPAIGGLQNGKPTKEQVTKLGTLPRDRFLVLESIALKGTIPPNTYIAIELRTLIRPLPGTQPVWVRHFLYSQGSGANTLVLNVREPLKIYADAGTEVSVGVQSTSGSPIEKIDVALTGSLIGVCLWGQ